MKIELAKNELIHFVGIGGIGMNGLAIIMKGLGFKVQGSDLFSNKNTDNLKKEKIKVFFGHNKRNIKNSTILVISSAIKKNNPEYTEAKKKGLPIYKRGEMLGHIVSLMKNIVVAGSHGKTTTTSLISSIFAKSNIDATVINGGILNAFENSARLGKSNWCILESDESDGSFLNLPLTYSIVTNLDSEHLDYYKSLENLKKNFINFINKTPSFGKNFICIDDKNNKSILSKLKNTNFLTYGVDKKSNFRIFNISQNIYYSKFDIKITIPGKKDKYLRNVKIPLNGLHNIRNATAASAVASTVGISKDFIKNGLKSFKGVQRRFSFLFKYRDAIFIDDYAHHPTEISEVLNGVKDVYKNKKIICVFQPHRISRVKNLRKEFSKSFKNADEVILCPIYKAGENSKTKINYDNFAKEIIKNSDVKLILINDQYELSKYVRQCVYGQSIVIGMGAGTISNWMKMIPNLI